MEVIKYIEDGKIKIIVVSGELREILDEIEFLDDMKEESDKKSVKAETQAAKVDNKIPSKLKKHR